MKSLYKFEWDCGRQGTVRGIFTAEPKEVEDAIGKQVYFGEILGKHSEIHGTLSREDLDNLTNDEDFIAKAESYGMVPMGYNPLFYIEEKEDIDDALPRED